MGMGSREKELYTLLRLSFKLWLVFSCFLEFRNINIDVFFGIIISYIRKSCLSHRFFFQIENADIRNPNLYVTNPQFSWAPAAKSGIAMRSIFGKG